MSVDVRFNTTTTVKDSVTAEQFAGKAVDTTNSRTKFSSQGFTVANAVVNQLLDVDGIATIKDIYITTDQNISIRVNANTNVAMPFSDVFSMQGATITALYLSNASGNTANVTVLLAGD